ncbi:hypothetical protein NDU88_002306 [Pleurodeles waltl]|uniref:Uncharacterized protein n=1 Tax=Pleurodeles waltl TaxID=8319 RepID=A0AAV7TKC7_PLEWA|nr:hypothetical protein NDU88_002306 [Pleurodeles waltl]
MRTWRWVHLVPAQSLASSHNVPGVSCFSLFWGFRHFSPLARTYPLRGRGGGGAGAAQRAPAARGGRDTTELLTEPHLVPAREFPVSMKRAAGGFRKAAARLIAAPRINRVKLNSYASIFCYNAALIPERQPPVKQLNTSCDPEFDELSLSSALDK